MLLFSAPETLILLGLCSHVTPLHSDPGGPLFLQIGKMGLFPVGVVQKADAVCVRRAGTPSLAHHLCGPTLTVAHTALHPPSCFPFPQRHTVLAAAAP